VGLVHLACATRRGHCAWRECHFGDLGRQRIRNLALQRALEMIGETLEEGAQ
jgi:nicotinamide-nucleotide amidase